MTKAIERFAKYLVDVEDEAKKPVFHVDSNGDIETGDEVGSAGPGGETFVYVAVSTKSYASCFAITFFIFTVVLSWTLETACLLEVL